MVTLLNVQGVDLYLSRVEEHSLNEADIPPHLSLVVQNFSSSKRRRQFLMGRLAAREVLAALKRGDLPIGSGERGEPLWPEDIVGSITHTASVALAVGAFAKSGCAVGIDIEDKARSLSHAVIERISTEGEREWLFEEKGLVNERALTLFSVKESVFKALYPTLRRELSFKDAEVRLQGDFISVDVVRGAELREKLYGTILADPAHIITLLTWQKR